MDYTTPLILLAFGLIPFWYLWHDTKDLRRKRNQPMAVRKR